MQVQEAFIKVRKELISLYGDRESEQIAHWVIERITGLTRSGRLLHKSDLLTEDQESTFHQCLSELLAWRPVQYVLGESWFAGMKFFVDERVLIPRPETEEMVEEVESRKSKIESEQPVRLLDVGTGSGCIAISLKKKNEGWDVWGVDKSNDALAVARINAKNLGADIHFFQADILDDKSRALLPVFDIIVSNPPYIPVKDKDQMRDNVLKYEPHAALFVNNNDPIIFYREIIHFSVDHLKPGGLLFFEIHEQLAEEVISLLSSNGYLQIKLKQDMQGRDRMIFAVKP